MSSFQEDQGKPQKIFLEEYLKEQGVNDFGKVSITTETTITRAEIASRLRREEAETNARLRLEEKVENNRLELEKKAESSKRFKSLSAYIVGLILTLAIAGGSLTFIFSDNATENDKKWAQSTLTGLFGAMAGFVFAKGDK